MPRLAERSFSIDVTHGLDHCQLRVSGEVAASDARALYDAIDDALLRRPAVVTVDLRDSDTTLPALLAVLVRATRLARARRTTVRVVTGDQLRDAINRRGLRHWINLADA